MRTAIFHAVTAVLLSVPSIASAGPRVPTHVVCIGDSITRGAGNSIGKDWPADLRAIFAGSAEVMNYGLDGRTMLTTGDQPYENEPTYQEAQDHVANAGKGAVVDVIIMLGTNDSKSFNWTPDGMPKQDVQFATDAAAMIDTFANLPTHPVVYVALPPWASPTNVHDGTVIHDEVIPVLKKVAEEKGVPLIDVNTPTSAHPEFFPDGAHPDDEGAAFIAQVMHDGLFRVPTVRLTSPHASDSVDAPVTLHVDASGGDTVAIRRVEFFEGSNSLGVATHSPFSLVWKNPTRGTHTIKAKATDTTDASSTSKTLSFRVASREPGGDGGGSGSGGGSDSSSNDNDESSGCASSPGSSGGALLAFFGLALFALQRRIRRS